MKLYDLKFKIENGRKVYQAVKIGTELNGFMNSLENVNFETIKNHILECLYNSRNISSSLIIGEELIRIENDLIGKEEENKIEILESEKMNLENHEDWVLFNWKGLEDSVFIYDFDENIKDKELRRLDFIEKYFKKYEMILSKNGLLVLVGKSIRDKKLNEFMLG